MTEVVEHGLWWELRGEPDAARVDDVVRAAETGGAVGLQVHAGAAAEAWTDFGFRPLAPGAAVLVRSVPQVLVGVAATRALGQRLAAALRPGDLLVLSGPLGAGKTALTQGIGAALGVRGKVTSPTFVLAREHRGPVPLVHVDAYRLRDSGVRAGSSAADRLADLDLEAALEDSVVVVEWGRGLVEDVADAWLDIELDRTGADLDPGTPERRSVRVHAHGLRWSVVQPPS